MKLVFADTLYWVAGLMPTDTWHNAAVAYNAGFEKSTHLITTEEVLTEVLSTFSDGGSHLRGQATALIRSLFLANQVTVLPQTHDTFLNGLMLYEARRDKGYSLVDCVSMQTMRTLGIREVLTNDRHFTQEGFTILIDKRE